MLISGRAVRFRRDRIIELKSKTLLAEKRTWEPKKGRHPYPEFCALCGLSTLPRALSSDST